MKAILLFLLLGAVLCAQMPTKSAPPSPELLRVKRIFVGPLTGGTAADALRDLIISSIDSTGLFILTDNEERADAILKGAADDKTFEDTFDTSGGLSSHSGMGKTTSGGSSSSRLGNSLSSGVSDNESHHIKERKHEAFATVRLCNRDGDVLWSTTQESLGAKFHGASADVAAKIARQLELDLARIHQPAVAH